ncbi:MAG: integrase arm-type DNA-binding domain-containing protein [Sphingomonadaceae bacterium]
MGKKFVHRLSARKVQYAPPGRHIDGAGLMLVVQPAGSRSWVLRIQHRGRRRDIGLGSYPVVTLARARELALETRRAVRDGRDPVAERRQWATVPLLSQALDAWIAKEAPGWRGGAEGHTARNTPRLFERHLGGLMRRRVSDIDEAAITTALMGVWHERRETAKKLFDRLRGVMNLAKAKGHCGKLDWEAIRAALPSGKVATVRHPAMKLADVPGFAAWLLAKDTGAARALLFILLTAARSGEVRGARWEEVSFEDGVWTVPAERAKTKRPHPVPLAPAATALLHRAAADRDLLRRGSPWCFPGPTTGRPLTDVAVSKLLREAGHAQATVHGFRSCFRDWAADIAEAPREIAEACLAHAPQGGAVEAAYRRTTMLERRRSLMASWADFVMQDVRANG